MKTAQKIRANWPELRPALLTMVQSGIPLRESMELFGRAYVGAALEITNGNQIKASRLIQTHRNTIGRWSKRK